MRFAIILILSSALYAGEAARPALEVPFFRQEKNGCGAATVSMVMHYWAGQSSSRALTPPPPEQVYRSLYDAERKVIPLSGMKRYFETHGFRAFTLRGQWNDIERNVSKGRPVIVGIRPKSKAGIHFGVVVGTRDGKVWLNDPTQKKLKRMKQEKFEKQWELAGRWMLLATPSADQRKSSTSRTLPASPSGVNGF